MAKKRGLGRGLEALLGDINKKVDTERKAAPSLAMTSENNSATATMVGPKIEGDLRSLALNVIIAGKYQPRKAFAEDSIRELADSIRAQGVIQPIVVRTIAANQYEIVAGERRFRAAKVAGLDTIPALIRELPDEAAIAMALIENIQREDLNPIEEAVGLQRLIDEFEMTHQQVANAVGKSRTAVTNLLRLLGLQTDVRQMLETGKLEMGHARALLTLADASQITTAQTIADKALSVRDAEQLVKRIQNLQATNPHAANFHPKNIDPTTHELQTRIGSQLNATVLLQQNAKGQGKLVINYRNQPHLRELLQKMQLGSCMEI